MHITSMQKFLLKNTVKPIHKQVHKKSSYISKVIVIS
jgi:hypothetical protein